MEDKKVNCVNCGLPIKREDLGMINKEGWFHKDCMPENTKEQMKKLEIKTGSLGRDWHN